MIAVFNPRPWIENAVEYINACKSNKRKEVKMEEQKDESCGTQAAPGAQIGAAAPVEKVDLNRAVSITAEQINDVMAYHPWDETKIAQGNKVRVALGDALKVIIENVPPSPDRSCAIRKLRDARMDCNSAITHNGKF